MFAFSWVARRLCNNENQKDKRGYRDQYVLFIILPAEFEPFILKRKLDIYKIRNNTIERSIICIEKQEEKSLFDVSLLILMTACT